LSLAEQKWPIDRLTQQVQNKNQSKSKVSEMSSTERQLQEMPKSPDIPREVAIHQEFKISELDSLEDL